jgi:hypothetical protein
MALLCFRLPNCSGAITYCSGAAAYKASDRSIISRPKVLFHRLKLASYNIIVRSFSTSKTFSFFSSMQLVPFQDRRGEYPVAKGKLSIVASKSPAIKCQQCTPVGPDAVRSRDLRHASMCSGVVISNWSVGNSLSMSETFICRRIPRGVCVDSRGNFKGAVQYAVSSFRDP